MITTLTRYELFVRSILCGAGIIFGFTIAIVCLLIVLSIGGTILNSITNEKGL